MKFLNQELVNAKDLGKDFCGAAHGAAARAVEWAVGLWAGCSAADIGFNKKYILNRAGGGMG
eukprot:363698-Chlamydomonas_euryale.AAC.1